MIVSNLLGGIEPPEKDFADYVEEKINENSLVSNNFKKNYVQTESVKGHLRNLARAVRIKRYPVLLQGPTSSGKTSLVQYVAAYTGHEFVRINNHEHTDLQEYLGSYVTGPQGELQFQEGVLVKAVRNGYWIVLDELNLAPSDVLEALNRLLDDNRQIFVPETQETISAHADFMLFATQNPPMLYGGRKVLSRAFRNRFLEIHVDEIPEDELKTIVEKRCALPGSYASKMVEVMKDLQLHRQNSKAFAGKHGFITPRDLFRWARRFREYGTSYHDLARDGYHLLAERLRDPNERNVVLKTLQRQLRVRLVMDDLYKLEQSDEDAVLKCRKECGSQNITWTRTMERLFFLVYRCYKLREPVLLIGETGGGKTSVCQFLSAFLGIQLHILNCHQTTESSDFIGGFYPVRRRSELAQKFKDLVEGLKQSKDFLHYSLDFDLSPDISEASLTTKKPCEMKKIAAEFPAVEELLQMQQEWQSIFVWQDGPLVEAMKCGHLLLVDEISLADDSVLERLNSVLEPERELSLAEKGGSILEKITADANFFILATMNPGGDYGKKELSPALRNRFTEIWVPSVDDVDELRCIAAERFVKSELSKFADYIVNFWQWFDQLQTGRTLTVRDLLSWVSFFNATEAALKPEYAFIHGAFLILLDGLSLGTGMGKCDAKTLRESSLSFLLEELKASGSAFLNPDLSKMDTYGWGGSTKLPVGISPDDEHLFGIKPFYIAKGSSVCKNQGFEFSAPTTCRNAMRILRALQLPKPVLLEGSPGVGKTSLVVALAEYSGHNVVRINLSEQTDMMDLLGSDLPVEGENGMKFSWSDGILLQALKAGSWVLLDELNLAPQSVLEGLNAILDHRAEVYIPELGQTYKCHASFRVFACQNPSCQGSGRKGLPKSFLNRFTKVYVDELCANDYLDICHSRHPSIPTSLLSKLIKFNNSLYNDTMIDRKYGQEGSPWEFNLRDVFRSCQIMEGAPDNRKITSFLNIVYLQRMRTATDRKKVVKLYESVFGVNPSIFQLPEIHVNPQNLIVGSARVERNHFQSQKKNLKNLLHMLPGIAYTLEAVVNCVQYQWLTILVGPYSSGKTSLIRLLAQLTGNTLIELNLSSGTDVSELLGCFEQYNSFRILRDAMSQVERYVNEYFSLRLAKNWEDLIKGRQSVLTKWLKFLAVSKYQSCMPIDEFASAWNDGSCRSLGPLTEIIEVLRADLKIFRLPISYTRKDLKKLLMMVNDLKQNSKIQQPAKFQWVAGDLLKAIECGDWVVLDNANLCNPTVLDRINSLVEPEGSITINECGLVNKKHVKLIAHPKFRLFLTVDPKHGEVSRAMRNRGLEIFMMQPNWSSEGRGVHDFDDSDLCDVRRFLVLSGIPFHKLVSVMSEAHMYAKNAGINLGVHVTLLELNRWVQLFQHLLMNGNQPSWSLQLSWMHTYLSSLGEDGRDTINIAKALYLSTTESFNMGPLSACFLSMPGGWASPQSVKNLVCYSTEACVRQNCAYLEFLGTQCTAYVLRTSKDGTFPENQQWKIMPSGVVRYFQFANAPYSQNHESDEGGVFMAQANQRLFFAANWTMEQATESDFSLYVQWFNWYNTQMQPYCHFFEFLEQERVHPIWNGIFSLQKRIVSHYKLDMDAHPIPLLSNKLFEVIGSDECMEVYKRLLGKLICFVPLLRLTYQQWKAEANFYKTGNPLANLIRCLKEEVLGKIRCLEEEVIRCLEEEVIRCLEEEVLDKILVSEEVIHVYSNFLEHHIFFWRNLVSSDFENASIIWHWLKKEASKLKPTFPAAVSPLLVISGNWYDTLDFSMNSETNRLWVHGGCPFLPSSSNVYSKMQRIYSFCDDKWQWKRNNTNWDDVVAMGILSANTKLRQTATEAICSSSDITTKGDQDEATIIQQLVKIYEELDGKFEQEKKKLEIIIQSSESSSNPLLGCSVTTCCTFSEEILCRNLKQLCSGYDIWMQTFPLFNKKSLSLDIKLLEELSKSLLLDPIDDDQVLLNSSNLLRESFNYALNFSSRSPVDFSPQQTMLSIFDAWNSIDSVHAKIAIATALHEMWFRWHSSLWNCSSGMLEIFPPDRDNKSFNLILLTRATILNKILQDTFYIEDFDMQCLKLRAVSRNLWEDMALPGNLVSVLLSAADTLFKQIIFVHRKYIDENTFGKIKVTLYELRQRGDSKDYLISLMSSSRHNIPESLVEPIVEALLEDHRSCESLYHLGSAWFHIGVLRFRLLLNPNASDPAKKYALKRALVEEKISLLKLENEVRQDCQHLTGRSATRDDGEQYLSKLQKLEDEQKRIQSKVVFRPEPSEYKKLRTECVDFLKDTKICSELMKTLKCGADIQTIIEASNWQDKALSFIGRLREAYAEYKDISQPVQVSIYEMKLGLSLAVSNAVEREYQKKTDGENSEGILATVYSLMQFPTMTTPSNLKTIQTVVINFLKKQTNIFSEVGDNKALQATVHHIILIRVAHQICSSLIMDMDSFQFLDEIFAHFVSLWLEMKSQNKVKEESDVQCVKFKPRSIDIPVTDSDESFASESTEILMEQEFSEKQHAKENEHMEEDWSMIPESILKSLVLVHNQLFGSRGVVESTGICEITGRNRLHSFVDSYRLGSKLMKDLQALSSLTLDDRLMPEHVLYVSLQYEQTVGLTSQSSTVYNVYKDSNASALSKMVKPLNAIQEKVTHLLEEWPEHPGLQKLVDLVNALLRIPANTPVSKALLGLQLLFSRAQRLQENFSRFNLSDQLQPICALVSSWQKLELECWPSLLDEVQENHDLNAGKLWFPLRAVLHRNLSGVDKFEMFTVKSIEEFIQTSSVGEFNKRMQLLLAFHGELNRGFCLQAYPTSPYLKKNMCILYNAFGYYVQYRPIVLEHIQNSENGRKDIERKLKECLKLYNWEHSSVEIFRRTRQKMWKLIKQFNDVLQKPVMKILAEDAALKREKVPSWLEQKISNENNEDLLQFPLDIVRLSTMERFLWCEEWKVKALQPISGSTSRACFLKNEGIADLTITSKFTEENCMIAWKKGWISLGMICQKAAEFAHEWKHGTKKNIKLRALGELFKTLEGCGLSKHRSMGSGLETEAVEATSLFLKPSYGVLHLGQSWCCPSLEDSITHPPNSPPKGVDERSELSWESSNRCYFQNLGILQQLRQLRHQFHNDLELEQVNQAVSYVDHLIDIQQQQRHAAFSVFEQLKKLRDQMYYLSCIDMGGECYLALNQSSVLKCMRRQKLLFDNLLTMSKDVQLLLQCCKHGHKNTCELPGDEAADKVSLLLDKFIPIFLQSKESLDKNLLGGDGTMAASTTFTPFIISHPMEVLVTSNFQVLNNFEQDIVTFWTQGLFRRSVVESLLNRLKELLIEGKMIWADFSSEMEASSQSVCKGEEQLSPESIGNIIEEVYRKTFSSEMEARSQSVCKGEEQLSPESIGNIIERLLMDVYGKADIFQKEHSFVGDLSIGNIHSWEKLFRSCMVNLHLHRLHVYLIETMKSLSERIDCAATGKQEVCSLVYSHLKDLHGSLEILLTFAGNLLSEFLDAHKTIAEMTHVLAHIFILLFQKGFGCAKEPSESNHRSENASGTGMGEGQGANDVSNQIEDEAQLLGTSNEKDGLDNSNQVAGNEDKGIEMDEDFEANTVSVSEDSGESDNEDEEDVNLESQFGETGENKQVVDEKLGDRDEVDKPDDNSLEKYESGPSVKETESKDREMRANEDDMPSVEESELDKNCQDEHHDDDKTLYNSDGENEMNDMNLDKDNAFEKPTGIQLNEEEDIDEQEQDTGDVNMEEPQDSDMMEEAIPECDEEMRDDGEQSNPTEEMDDENSNPLDDNINTETKETGNDDENGQVDMESSKENIQSSMVESLDQSTEVQMEQEMLWSNSNDMNSSIAPSRSSLFDENPNMELSVSDSTDNSRLASNRPNPQTSQGDSPSAEKSRSNPYRSIGDVMKDWKERVRVSVDSQENHQEGPEDIHEKDGDEYRYVSEAEKSTSQALGSATNDQINDNVEGNKGCDDEGNVKKDEYDKNDSIMENSETNQVITTSYPVIPKQKMDAEVVDMPMKDDEVMEEMQQTNSDNNLGDMISFNSSYMNEKVLPLGTLGIGSDLWKPIGSHDAHQKMKDEWRRYELATAKLSQELAEQLRLVMEPNRTNKLQGDYKTGKRINMKKVIPYIASQYRKDKIWLRRTRPDKRDYQVVVAIDDSRSMSESNCGNIAIESLVTVCRAMSQSEVGQFAVAGFGEKNKIKLLHDFDEPFTTEAGIKMISSLSFQQDNSIADEPVVDLLRYLNNMLDAAVVKARLPSGQNPLNQLILILADGKFHENKENLKRCVRDFSNKKRMIVFVLLDPKESIMELTEYSFEGGKVSTSKYLSSFPFPYYILLKNMEKLPRALTDLLSQWIEEMRSRRD